MGVSEKSIASSGQTRSRLETLKEKLVARELSWKSNVDESYGYGHVLRMDQDPIPKVALAKQFDPLKGQHISLEI